MGLLFEGPMFRIIFRARNYVPSMDCKGLCERGSALIIQRTHETTQRLIYKHTGEMEEPYAHVCPVKVYVFQNFLHNEVLLNTQSTHLSFPSLLLLLFARY